MLQPRVQEQNSIETVKPTEININETNKGVARLARCASITLHIEIHGNYADCAECHSVRENGGRTCYRDIGTEGNNIEKGSEMRK